MLSDLRHALRALRRAPGFTAAAVLCLGLGLGANTTIYSLVNAMLLRPLPYHEPHRLVAVELLDRASGAPIGTMSVPYVVDLRERARTLAGVSAYVARTVSLAGRDGAEAVDAALVSSDFFATLGVRPTVGRGFLPAESAPGAERVAVVNESFWRTRLGGAADAVGRPITLDGVPTTVVGVAPDRVGLTGDREQLWLPMVHDRDPGLRATRLVRALARVRDGATVEEAAREVAAIAARVAEEHPDVDGRLTATVRPLHEAMVPEHVKLVFGVMMGAVGFVLLIACANVANLLLSRGAARRRELAVRAALGAGRARVVRLVLAEAVLVALAGGALGVLIAYASVGALRGAVPLAYPAWIVMDVDARVLVYALVVSAATGLAAGLVPALCATRPSLAPTLRDGARGATAGAGARWLRDGLVVGELALSLVLLAGAGLMVKSVLRVHRADPGFEPAGVLAVRVYLGGDRYAGRAARAEVYRRALERVGALPGVARVEAMSVAPLAGGATISTFSVEGRPEEPGRPSNAQWRPVSPGALAALGVPLVEGRWLTRAETLDTASTAVVVGAELARRTWPGESAVGKRIAFVRGDAPVWLTVVGVARDVARTGLGERVPVQAWRPWATAAGRAMTLLVRADDGATGTAAALAPAVRRALAEVDPTLPVEEVRTMDGIVSDSLWGERLYGVLFGSFAVAALALAVVGVYGVVAYQVAQRMRELGVRVALGASAADLYRLVLGQGGRLAAAGLAIGLVLALALTRVLASALAGVSATDPVVLGGVSAALAAAALLATWVPARRATRADPTEVLRAE